MPEQKIYKFFLGANTPNGFVSFFDHLVDLESAKEVLILKGGPGIGKSTFMRSAAAGLIEAGLTTEWIVCSSDPDSLDGVVFPKIGVAFVDGSKPHVVEPEYPYIVERYIDLGYFCDRDLLSENIQKKIKQLITEYEAQYESVYRCIKAARFVSDDTFGTVFDMDVVNKIKKRVAGIIKREIPINRSKGSRTADDSKQGAQIKRFLSAMTSKGNIVLSETIKTLASRVYEINDTYGYSHFMLSPILNVATTAGYDVIACYCPMNPELKLEHLIIPELSLTFFTVHSDFEGVGSPYRRIHLDAYIPSEILQSNRQRLKFMRRTCTSLLEEAGENLRVARGIRADIEALYSPAINFEGINALAKDTSSGLMDRYRQYILSPKATDPKD